MLSSHPIHQKLSLSESVSDPVKAHVYGYLTPLADVVIDKSVSCGAVCHYWGGWLGVDHLYERHLCCFSSLPVYKKGSHFCFHCGSEDISHGHAFDMNWSIEWWFLKGGLLESADSVMR